MKKFLVSYAYSVLSLLIIINIIQQYNYVLLEGKSKYNIFIDVYVNTIQATLVACILGAPMVLFGCILGELLFRYIILLNKYNFIFSVIIYIFLGSGLISIFFIFGISHFLRISNYYGYSSIYVNDQYLFCYIFYE